MSCPWRTKSNRPPTLGVDVEAPAACRKTFNKSVGSWSETLELASTEAWEPYAGLQVHAEPRPQNCRCACGPVDPSSVQALQTGRGNRLTGSSLQGCHHADGECAKTQQRSPTGPFKSSKFFKASTKSRLGQKRQCATTRQKKSLWKPQNHVSLEAGGGQKKDPSAASRESFRGSVASGLVAPVSADPDGTRISVGVSPTSLRSDPFRPETCLWGNQQATSPDSLCRHPVAKLTTSHWQSATERRMSPTVSSSQTEHLKAPSCQAPNPATVRRSATQLVAIWSFTPFRLKSVRKAFGRCVEVFPDARGTLRRAAAHNARRLQHVRCTASTCHASDGSSHCWACLPG